MIKRNLLLLTLGLGLAAPVAAQLLGQTVGGLGQSVGQTVGGVGQSVGGVGQSAGRTVGSVVGNSLGGSLDQRTLETATAPGSTLRSVTSPIGRITTEAGVLRELRRLRHAELIRANPAELEAGEGGVPVRRGRLLLVDPTAAHLAAATRLGLRATASERDPALGLTMVTLSLPPRLTVRKALKSLREAAPGIAVDADPVFEPAGGGLGPMTASALAAGAGTPTAARRIAMVDGGVAAHPSMARASIEQKGFAGRAAATGHGTAVASLLVGRDGRFAGAATGASLFVADIYGGNPAAGSASAIVRALGWAASKRPQVITVSLVGPPNAALERAVGALRRLGIELVAAVGNDGPAAPPAYPASYDGVLAVTGVDAKGRALPEAGKPRHLDYAAPGAAMAAALPGQGYADVRGTSFAAPLAAARVLAHGSAARLASEAQPGKGRVGRGIVCAACRVDPKVVGAK